MKMKTVTLSEVDWYPVYTIDDEPLKSDQTSEISDELLIEYKAVMEAFDVMQERVRVLLEKEYA